MCDDGIKEVIKNITKKIEDIPCIDIQYNETVFAENIIQCHNFQSNTRGLVTPRSSDKTKFVMLIHSESTGLVLKNIVLHEFGHTLGLKHVCFPPSVMAPVVDETREMDFTMEQQQQIRKRYLKNTFKCNQFFNLLNKMNFKDFEY
jgi:hypothetical protein